MDIYEICPQLESANYLLRQTCLKDCDDLLKVYSDPAAWPIFNSDNCTGDFHITKPEDMENCIRFWLDALASVQFLLTGKWGSFLSVWRARRDFFRMRPQFAADRERNLREAVLSPVPEQTDVSILWQYYARGRKTFADIHQTKNDIKQHI